MRTKGIPTHEDGFYIEHFTKGEVDDLDRALGESLRGEIGMLRIVMRRFFERSAHEADDLKGLADALRVLSLSCSRLAKLIQTEKVLQENQADELGEALTRSMAAVLDEMSSSGASTALGGDDLGR